MAEVALPPNADMVAIATAAGNGDVSARLYIGGKLVVSGVTQAALDAAVAHVGTAPSKFVPRSVALWRARAALAEAGMIAAVDAAVASLGGAAEQWWQYGAEVERAHPRIAEIAAALGLTGAQIDDLFRRAAVIEP